MAEKILVKALTSFASGGGGLSMRKNQQLPVTQAMVDQYGPKGCGFVKVCSSDENVEAELEALKAEFDAERKSVASAHQLELKQKDKAHAEALDAQKAEYEQQLKELRKELKDAQEGANKAIAAAEKVTAKAEKAEARAKAATEAADQAKADAEKAAADQGDLLKDGDDKTDDDGEKTEDGGDKTEGGEGSENTEPADTPDGAAKETKPANAKKPAANKPKSEAGLG